MICLVHILLTELMKLLIGPESVLTKFREKNNQIYLSLQQSEAFLRYDRNDNKVFKGDVF